MCFGTKATFTLKDAIEDRVPDGLYINQADSYRDGSHYFIVKKGEQVRHGLTIPEVYGQDIVGFPTPVGIYVGARFDRAIVVETPLVLQTEIMGSMAAAIRNTEKVELISVDAKWVETVDRRFIYLNEQANNYNTEWPWDDSEDEDEDDDSFRSKTNAASFDPCI